MELKHRKPVYRITIEKDYIEENNSKVQSTETWLYYGQFPPWILPAPESGIYILDGDELVRID